jgi:hypothetical protein
LARNRKGGIELIKTLLIPPGKRLLGLLCLLALAMPLYADMTRAELQKMYLDFLKSQNIKAQVDQDGDIEFIWEGTHFKTMTYYIVVDETDQQFFQIVKVGGYPLETSQEKRRAPLAASYATKKTEVVKLFVNSRGDNIFVSAEMLLASPGDFKAAFPKLMREIEKAMLYFLEQME